MTEAEWLACEDPVRMFAFLKRKKSARKQRLFACACCRLVWGQMPPSWRLAVMVNERYADALATRDELVTAVRVAFRDAGYNTASMQAAAFACDTAHPVNESASCAAYQTGLADPEALPKQAALLRDVFAPFRGRRPFPASWQSWNGRTVPSIAEAIYEERLFERLPILSDALEEAGCTDADILSHLRSPGPHVRGCWALDLILGKS
jgi:hypothetical protein